MADVADGHLTAKGRATRERIVQAASELMLEQGAARTTVEDIQHRAGVSASQLYHYFADKDALVLAVIDHQTDVVLDVQHRGLDRLDSIEGLQEWRDIVVDVLRRAHCIGGCPLGSLASDIVETHPIARDRLAASFARWEGLLRESFTGMRDRGQLRPDADPDELALAMLAALQGGLLLSQVRRQTTPLEVALDSVIAHVRSLAV